VGTCPLSVLPFPFDVCPNGCGTTGGAGGVRRGDEQAAALPRRPDTRELYAPQDGNEPRLRPGHDQVAMACVQSVAALF
jgi:hypothetical protein